MRKGEEKVYICPYSGSSLRLEEEAKEGEHVKEGKLLNESGDEFPIHEGIADLTWPRSLAETDRKTREIYEKLADEYDNFAEFPFQTFGESQHELRLKMLDQLNIKAGDRVLEIGCGDGRGSEYIAKQLGDKGELYMQELSIAFLKKAIERVKSTKVKKEYSVANASYLSFPDNYFDAAHHFGGINTFAEVERCLNELARVVKPGGKVVIGDEGMGPWLKETEFGKIMMNSNPLLKYEVPFDKIPVEARKVKVEWVCKGAFFLLEFEVGEGEPEANYHIPIPSERGGTHWTRYHGNLEGVTDEAKAMAYKARKKSGISMHDWLERAVRSAAQKDLDN